MQVDTLPMTPASSNLTVANASTATVAAKTKLPVPMLAAILLSWPAFKLDLETQEHGSGPAAYISLSLSLRRSWTTKLFVCINLVLSWALSVWTLVIALDHVIIRPREVDPGTIGYTVTLLFALPGMRAAMPFAPPLGSLVDIVGLLWCLILVSLAAVTLMAGFFGQHTHKGGLFEDELVLDQVL
jgi:hypothetical protein